MGAINWLAVSMAFLGAGLGGSVRYLATVVLAQPVWLPFAFPVLFVNIVGGFIAGLLFAWIGPLVLKSEAVGVFLMAGFLGGLTTFSAFTAESAMLMLERPAAALLQMIAHVVGCLVAFTLAYKLASVLQ